MGKFKWAELPRSPRPGSPCEKKSRDYDATFMAPAVLVIALVVVAFILGALIF